MKRKNQITKLLACSFTVLSMLLVSANSISAQCGNFFKQTYQGIVKPRFPNGAIFLDDLTGDGKSDLWTVQLNPSNNALLDLLVYPRKASGFWDLENPVAYPTSIGYLDPYYYKVVDLDSDGFNDIYHNSNPVQILHNNGNGSFIAYPSLTDSDGAVRTDRIITFTDLNGDGLKDAIYYLTINEVSQIRYQLQNPNGTFSGKTNIFTGSSQYGSIIVSIIAGDFNGDGKTDIIANNLHGSQSYNLLFKNNGSGNFEIINQLPSGLGVSYAHVKDFNNDGRDDIQKEGVIFYGRADSGFDRVELPGSSTNRSILPAKLNADGSWDFVELSPTFYAAYINNGGTNFTRTVYLNSPVLSVSGPENSWKFEDFNNDGKDDFYDLRFDNFVSYKFNIFGERLISAMTNNCQFYGETKLGNFDGNANADLTTWNPNSGNWTSKNAVWGSGADASARNFQWGTGALGDVAAPGDYDGDGKTDYAVYRNSTGVWYVFKSSDSSWMTFQFGTTGDIAVPNDYDGGGKTDFAVFRPSNGSWYFWHNETQHFSGVQFGANGDKPVPADYDGDRKTDVAVFRPSTGVWYYLKSSDNGFRAIQWGTATDKPVPADYDGDGKADLTIYRNGEWWMLRSSNNSVAAILYGTANDIPVPIYRNSISADLSLYNPANNTWNYFSNRYAPGIALGGSQDKPVYFGLPND